MDVYTSTNVPPNAVHGSRQVPIMPALVLAAASSYNPTTTPPPSTTTTATTAATTTNTTTMPFNCQACVRKKVKCDRNVQSCSSCRKSKLQCSYEPPAPRSRRKRRHGLASDIHESPNGLGSRNALASSPELITSSPAAQNTSTPPGMCTKCSTLVPSQQSAKAAGKLRLTGDGKTRYLHNVLFLEGVDGDLCDLSDSGEDEAGVDDTGTPTMLLGLVVAHPVSGTVAPGATATPTATQSLTKIHPSHPEAMRLWAIYTQNFEPLCKVLHIPTTAKMVERVSKQPEEASKNEECLLFIIYTCAVFTMSDVDCLEEFKVSRKHLMSKYQRAFYQALINASWLKTRALPVLQAYTLFLIAMRSQIDPDTFWVLTGIAVRLAQRMGLHRDGETLGLPPFEVQMRRRLFWQLLPLDGYAGQVSGSGISISPDSWDTRAPQNISDDQIFPSMTEQPQEQKRATEMIYCLARIELSNFYTRTGVQMKQGSGAMELREAEDIERLIDEVESFIETKLLRYCDILNPLHFLTFGIVRSATNAIRLRARMPPLIKQTISDAQRRDLCTLAQNILDTYNVINSNPNMKGFRWHLRAFFLWDALLCILLSLARPGFYSPSELNTSWAKVGQVYENHEALVKGKKSLHASIGRITLKAWIANPPNKASPEPGFISALRAQAHPKFNKRRQPSVDDGESDAAGSSLEPTDAGLGFDGGMEMDPDGNFTLDPIDWLYWDQLCQGVSMA